MSEFENPNLPENLPEKRIEVVTMRVGDIKTGFGNPRKIGKKKREELRAINIKDNTHAGEWDMDLLADWTADLNMDLGLDLQEGSPGERKIKEMELLNYEKYDYVMIVCKNEMDYNELTRRLGIDGAKVKINDKKKIKARAVWYHESGLSSM